MSGTDTYKGGSPSKIAVRALLWLSICDSLGSDFFTKKHVVLASRECGDVVALKALGVRPENIIACEINSDAADAARAAHPDVIVWKSDIFSVCRRYYRECASIYFDFCSPQTSSQLWKISKVASQAVMEGGFVAACFLAGRERRTTIEAIEDERVRMRAMRRVASEDVKSGGAKAEAHFASLARALCKRLRITPSAELFAMLVPALQSDSDLSSAFDDNDDDGWIESFVARHEAVSTHLARVASPDGWAIPLGGWYYTSKTRDSKGVPMFVWIGEVRRGRENQMRRVNNVGKPVCSRVLETDESLRDFLLDAQKGNRQAKIIQATMGVSDRTIAAWRAHRTISHRPASDR